MLAISHDYIITEHTHNVYRVMLMTLSGKCNGYFKTVADAKSIIGDDYGIIANTHGMGQPDKNRSIGTNTGYEASGGRR